MNENFEILNAYLHILEDNSIMPIFSNETIEFDEIIESYILNHVDKVINSDNLKLCKFKEESNLLKFIDLDKDNFYDMSVYVTKEIFGLMKCGTDIQSADILFLDVQIEEERKWIMLKLNHKTTFSHLINAENSKIQNILIEYKTALPANNNIIEEAYIINLQKKEVQVIDKKVININTNEKINYLTSLVLQCENSLTRKEKSVVLKHIVETAKIECSENPTQDAKINNDVNRFLDTEIEFTVGDIVEEVTKTVPQIKKIIYDNLVQNKIDISGSIEVTKSAKKKLEKKTIKTKQGIEMKIPYELYEDPSCLEFIKNSDGTTSILIKNIYY